MDDEQAFLQAQLRDIQKTVAKLMREGKKEQAMQIEKRLKQWGSK